MNIKDLFKLAVTKKASDVHLNVGLLPILRIDGELVPLKKFPEIVSKELEQMIFSILTQEQKDKLIEKRDLDMGYTLDENRFRINVHYEKDNIGLVARVIKDQMPTMDKIGLPKVVKELLDRGSGLILVTGPTGCGKSTTLAAMINYINSNHNKKIITLEDPIEFIFKPNKSLIIQRQLGSDIPSFASGLRHALRQDPNIIMVGEMRDLDTIGAAITLAETGHMVIATLHTHSAAQSIDRIIDVFPPYQQEQIRVQLSMVLSAVLSQRLIPKKEGGRIATREIMIKNPALSNLIRENKIPQIQNVIETNQSSGMISFDRDVKDLLKAGMITKEVAALNTTKKV